SSGAGAAADASIRAGAVLLAKKGLLTMKFAAAIKPTLGALAIGFTYGALALAGGPSADGGAGGRTEGEAAGSRAVEPAVVELTGGEAATPDADAPSGPTTYAEWMATPPAAGVPEALAATVAPGAHTPPSTRLGPAADVFVAAPQAFVAAPQVRPLVGFTPSSRAAVALEAEHWKLKASGLQKKVESLRLKARALREQRGPDVEIQALEVESEVDLTLAEVKLCEARAEQLREGLEQRPSAALGPPAATASPPAATSPIQAPTPAGMPDWNSHAYQYPTSGPPAGGGADGPSPGPADQTAPELHANALAGHRERLRAAIQELEAVTTTIIPEAENELAKQLAKQLEQLRAMNEKLQARLDELERQNKIQRPTIAY
ncbi:MAG TPA: hypothetical protein VEQ85_10905, partial [Lacipirellulaceae bacterium]|nr:hypothetical protein [Lacipirellulaceae bacterium]